MGNKKTDIYKIIFFFFFLVKRAGHHFCFFKRAGRHEKGAGRRALQKKPRQNTDEGILSNVISVMRESGHWEVCPISRKKRTLE